MTVKPEPMSAPVCAGWRLEAVPSGTSRELAAALGLRAVLGERSLEVLEVSDFGARISHTEELASENEVHEMVLRTAWNAELYRGGVRTVRVEAPSSSVLVEVEYCDGPLPAGLLRSLARLLEIERDLSDRSAEYGAVPGPFRTLVYEMRHFLRALKREIDQLEDELVVESEDRKKVALEALEIRFGDYVQEKLLGYSERLFALFKDLPDRKAMARCSSLFREELNSLFLHSPYARRAMEKPNGHAGDFEMMNQVYRNQYEGTTLFAKLVHKYTVNEFAAQSVRERRVYLRRRLEQFLWARGAANGRMKICSVASGSAGELVDFLEAFEQEPGIEVEITLVDQDLEALEHARRSLQPVMHSSGLPVIVRFLPISVKQMLERQPEAQDFLGSRFDFIYTAGLYDYLRDAVAVALTKLLYSQLEDGGTLLVGNFHPDTPTRAVCELSVDWHLMYRDEEAMRKLAQRAGADSFRISRDRLGYVVYTEMTPLGRR